MQVTCIISVEDFLTVAVFGNNGTLMLASKYTKEQLKIIVGDLSGFNIGSLIFMYKGLLLPSDESTKILRSLKSKDLYVSSFDLVVMKNIQTALKVSYAYLFDYTRYYDKFKASGRYLVLDKYPINKYAVIVVEGETVTDIYLSNEAQLADTIKVVKESKGIDSVVDAVRDVKSLYTQRLESLGVPKQQAKRIAPLVFCFSQVGSNQSKECFILLTNEYCGIGPAEIETFNEWQAAQEELALSSEVTTVIDKDGSNVIIGDDDYKGDDNFENVEDIEEESEEEEVESDIEEHREEFGSESENESGEDSEDDFEEDVFEEYPDEIRQDGINRLSIIKMFSSVTLAACILLALYMGIIIGISKNVTPVLEPMRVVSVNLSTEKINRDIGQAYSDLLYRSLNEDLYGKLIRDAITATDGVVLSGIYFTLQDYRITVYIGSNSGVEDLINVLVPSGKLISVEEQEPLVYRGFDFKAYKIIVAY